MKKQHKKVKSNARTLVALREKELKQVDGAGTHWSVLPTSTHHSEGGSDSTQDVAWSWG